MNKSIKVSIPTDENGLVGRECPSCKSYFKVKFGTGLKISYHICPYCGYKSEGNNFLTREQKELMQSTIANQIVAPMLNNFSRDLKKMETRPRGNSLISIKAKTNNISFPIKNYQERLLETDVVCDNCGLEFSIYGVFSDCPDCGKLNAKVIFTKNLDLNLAKLKVSKSEGIDKDMEKELLKSALIDSVSVFDSLGKILKKKYPTKFSKKPRNLFQNIKELNNSLKDNFDKNISDLIGGNEYDLIKRMFQVRHIYIHNSGVIDEDFLNTLPELSTLRGKIYPLNQEEIRSFINFLSKLGLAIYSLTEEKDTPGNA